MGITSDGSGRAYVAGVDRSARGIQFGVTKLSGDGSVICNWTDDPSPGYDISRGITADETKGLVYVVGSDQMQPSGEDEWRVSSLASDCTKRWARTLNPTTGADYASAVAIDPFSHDVFVAGFDGGPGNGQWRVERFDASGKPIWSWVENPSAGVDEARAIAVHDLSASDGGIWVAGDGAAASNDKQWLLMKLSEDGKRTATWESNPSQFDDSANSVALDKSPTAVYVAGYDSVNGKNDTEWRVVKLDPNLRPEWTWVLNMGSGRDEPTSVAVNAVGDVMVAGFSSQGASRSWELVKLDSAGSMVWNWSSDPSTGDDAVTSMTVDWDVDGGDLFVAGYDSLPGPNDQEWRVVKMKNRILPPSKLSIQASASPQDGEAPLPVTLRIITSKGGVPPVSASWDFGDGTSLSTWGTTHTYVAAGGYDAVASVVDSSGSSQSQKFRITVVENSSYRPITVRRIEAVPDQGDMPLTVTFTASVDGGVPPLTLTWDFGDGESAVGEKQVHTYRRSGSFVARLVLTDSAGHSANSSIPVGVREPGSAFLNPGLPLLGGVAIIGIVLLTIAVFTRRRLHQTTSASGARDA